MIDREVVGRVIRRQRERKGFSQEVLSGLAAIPRSSFGAVERGQRGMMLDTFWKIAEALGMCPSELQVAIEDEMEEEARNETRRNT